MHSLAALKIPVAPAMPRGHQWEPPGKLEKSALALTLNMVEILNDIDILLNSSNFHKPQNHAWECKKCSDDRVRFLPRKGMAPEKARSSCEHHRSWSNMVDPSYKSRK